MTEEQLKIRVHLDGKQMTKIEEREMIGHCFWWHGGIQNWGVCRDLVWDDRMDHYQLAMVEDSYGFLMKFYMVIM